MTKYKLETFATGEIFEDSGWTLNDPNCEVPSLIRALYSNKKLTVGDPSFGIYKFADWLPIIRRLDNSSSPITYKSVGLAKALNLSNLYITFSGYWPEMGGDMTTCSFKETEAYSVCARMVEGEKRVMVVASAGNTARAFAKVCSDNKIPILIVIPYDNLDALWFNHQINESVKVVSTPKGSDYFDAIALANRICSSSLLFYEEGGAKNVARRDGMGTTVLSAVTTIGSIPNYYFQAIGSGTGAIAAWEANLRLIEDGSYGKNKMKLVVSQNIPFTPIYHAWRERSREIVFLDEEQARQEALQIDAKVLSNRRPPYGVAGGLFDALKESDGEVEIITNLESKIAGLLFEECEGVDIHPAASVAVASLIKYREKIGKDESIMLNITGGGERLFKSQNSLNYLEPHLIVEPSISTEELVKSVESLFNAN